MKPEAVNLARKLSEFSQRWSPKIVASFNRMTSWWYKVKGRFGWHSHPDTDDFFLVLRGRLTIDMREGAVSLGPGELYVVPRGVEHCPLRREETELLLIEPEGAPNTGDPETAAIKTKI